MDIKERALESASARLANAIHNYKVSSGNQDTIARKQRAIDVAAYILRAVQAYNEKEMVTNGMERD